MKRNKRKRQPVTASGVGVGLVRFLSGTIDFCVLIILLLCLLFGFYALWDTHQLYEAADAKQYEIYKPTREDNRTFSDFQALNPEVIGWLTVYGTQIDYPLVQAEDNSKYVSLGADLNFSASGSLFLDYRNKADFTDFNSIIYGHHMAAEAMFGDLDKFLEQTFFQEHRYGSLYADGKTYGLEFFAVLEADAYDNALYAPAIADEASRNAYLEHVRSLAKYTAGDYATAQDRIVLLSTCAEAATNGRTLLAARLTDRVPENPFPEEETSASPAGADLYSFFAQWERIPLLVWAILLLVLLLVILVISKFVRRRRKKQKKSMKQLEQSQDE